MALDQPTTAERKLVANQHKLFALDIIVIVDFLFLKHFFYAKKQGQNSLSLPMFLFLSLYGM